MGAWYFLNARKAELLGGRHPAVARLAPREREPGDRQQGGHDLEQKILLDEAFAG